MHHLQFASHQVDYSIVCIFVYKFGNKWGSLPNLYNRFTLLPPLELVTSNVDFAN